MQGGAVPRPPEAPRPFAAAQRSDPASLSRVRFENDGRAVRQDLGDAVRDLVRVVAHPDDGVGPDLPGVAQHDLEGLLPGVLAQLRVERYVAAEEGLDPRADVADDAARADRDAPHDASRRGDAIAVETERGRHPLRLDG